MKIQIVIEIDAEDLERIKARTGKSSSDYIILDGKPLPKGHGDLKDQNELLTVLIKSAEAHCQNSREDALMGRVRQQILGCHTIIEADKENKE